MVSSIAPVVFTPRILRKFESIDGDTSYVFGLIDYEWESTQGLKTPESPLIAADYGFDHLDDSPGILDYGQERIRLSIHSVCDPSEIDDEIDNLRSKLYNIGLGKGYVIDKNGSMRWALMRALAIPTYTITGIATEAGRKIVATVIEFRRQSDWYDTTQISSITTITDNPQQVTVTNPGNRASRRVVMRLRANTFIDDAAVFIRQPNKVTNGNFETDISGWSNPPAGTNVCERSTTQAKFGSASMKCTYSNNKALASYPITLTPGDQHYFSFWLWIPTNYNGTNINGVFQNFGGGAGTFFAAANMSLRDQWQQVTVSPWAVDPGDLSGQLEITEEGTLPTAGRFIYVDGVKCTTLPVVAEYKEYHAPMWLSRASSSPLQTGDVTFDISVWVYLHRTLQAGEEWAIVAKCAFDDVTAEYRLGIIHAGGNLRFFFEVGDAATGLALTPVLANTFGTPSINTWYHLHALHDPTNNRIRIQVNNGSVNTTNTSAGIFSGTNELNIGFSGNGLRFPFDGRIQHLGMWKGGTLLSAGEVTELYNGGDPNLEYATLSSGLKDSRMIGWWPLTESSDGSIPVTRDDAHTNNLDLTDNGNVYGGYGGYDSPRVTNAANGHVFQTARDAASANSEVKLDTSAPSVEVSNNDGASYSPDFANYVIPSGQRPLSFDLEPGDNVLTIDANGLPNYSLEITADVAYV